VATVAAVATGTTVAVLLSGPTPVPVTNVTLSLIRTLTDPQAQAGYAFGAAAYSPDGLLATSEVSPAQVHKDSTYLWDSHGHIVKTLTLPQQATLYASAFSRDGRLLAVSDNGFDGGGTYVWRVATGRVIATLAHPAQGSGSLRFSPDGDTLAIGGDGKVYLWDAARAVSSGTLSDPGGGAATFAFSPDGRTLAVTYPNSGTVQLWDVAARKVTATLTDPASKGAGEVVYSPAGNLLAVTDRNGNAYVWNPATRHLVASMACPDHDGCPLLAFSPNGKTIVGIGQNNGGAYLWNAATGRMTAKAIDPNGFPFLGVAYSPNGRTLAMTDGLGKAYLWRTSIAPAAARHTSAATSP
jgi:WD40 repeat protein